MIIILRLSRTNTYLITIGSSIFHETKVVFFTFCRDISEWRHIIIFPIHVCFLVLAFVCLSTLWLIHVLIAWKIHFNMPWFTTTKACVVSITRISLGLETYLFFDLNLSRFFFLKNLLNFFVSRLKVLSWSESSSSSLEPSFVYYIESYTLNFIFRILLIIHLVKF